MTSPELTTLMGSLDDKDLIEQIWELREPGEKSLEEILTRLLKHYALLKSDFEFLEKQLARWR